MCVVFLMCMLSVLLFYFQNKKEQQLHIQAVKQYTDRIKKNKTQIRVRDNYLNHYNFTKQSLDEALFIQQEIDLSY